MLSNYQPLEFEQYLKKVVTLHWVAMRSTSLQFEKHCCGKFNKSCTLNYSYKRVLGEISLTSEKAFQSSVFGIHVYEWYIFKMC